MMKTKIFAVGFAAALAASMFGTALASPWEVSESANPNACFGQARAWWARDLAASGSSNGAVISTRKGDNPDNNAAFIAQYCTE